MPIDASIALGGKPMQVKSQGEYLNELYNQQNAEQTNQLNQMKLQDLQRANERQTKWDEGVAGLDPSSPDYATNRLRLFAAQGPEGLKQLSGILKEESAAKGEDVKTTAAKFESAHKNYSDYTATLGSLANDPTLTKEKAVAAADRLALMGIIPQSLADGARQLPDDPTTLRTSLIGLTKSQLSPKDMIEVFAPKPKQVDLGGSVQVYDENPNSPTYGKIITTTAKTPTPGEQKPTFNQGAWYYPPTAENPQGVRVGQPQGEMPKLKPGEVWDASAQTVKQVPGSAEYIKQSNLHGTDYNAAKTVVSKMDNAIKKVNEILKPENASGFENNFGGYNAAASRMFSGNTATVRRNIDTLKADMKGAGLELIRAGGSIGALTEREWPMLEAQIDAIDYMLDEPAAKDAFDRVKTTFERIKNQAKDTYQTTWGETQYYKPDVLKGAPPPPPAAAVKLTPEQKKKYDALKAKHG